MRVDDITVLLSEAPTADKNFQQKDGGIIKVVSPPDGPLQPQPRGA